VSARCDARLILALVIMAATAAGAQTRPAVIASIASPSPPVAVLLAKNGRMLAAFGEDKKLRMWSLPDGTLQQTIDGAARQFTTSAISPDGRAIAAGDFAGRSSVWDVATGEERMHVSLAFYPMALAFSPDSARLAIAPVGEPVQIYDVASGRKLSELQRVTGGTQALAFSRDGSRIATADADTVVRVYECATGKLLASNDAFVLEPLAVAFAADGKQVLAGGGDKFVAWIDAANGTTVRRSGRVDDPVAALDISPDGTRAVTALMHADNLLMPGAIIVTDVATGHRVSEWLPASRAIGGGWTADGHLLVATAESATIKLWRVQ